MYKGTFVFSEHSSGEFAPEDGDLIKYDNIVLSDGIQTAKFKNDTGLKKLDIVRGAEVEVDFEIQFSKTGPKLVAKNIKAVKSL